MDFPNLILSSQIVYFFCSMVSSRNPYLFMLSFLKLQRCLINGDIKEGSRDNIFTLMSGKHSGKINSGAQFLSSPNIETLNDGKTILALFRLYLEFP